MEELLAEHNIPEDVKTCLEKMPELFGSIDVLKEAKKIVCNEKSKASIERLEAIYEALKVYGVEDYITFDLGMVSKYKYYTGVIFKAYTYGVGEALITGGRYNSLLKHFGKDSAAIGCVLLVNQLMAALSRQKIEIPTEKNTVLLVCDGDNETEAVKHAEELRSKGEKVAVLRRNEKSLEECKEYADRNGFAKILHLDKNGCTEM